MIGQEVVKKVISKEEFKKAKRISSFVWKDNLSNEKNTASYDENNQHVVANASIGFGSFFSIFFDDVKKGDLIEVEALVKRASFDSSADNDYISIGTHHVDDETINNHPVFTGNSTSKSSEWEIVTFKNICTQSKRLRVDVGMYSDQSGIFYIKYIIAKLTKKSVGKNIRKIAFRQNRLNSPARWEMIEGDECTFTVDSSSKTLKLTYSEPFIEGHNPITILQSEYTNNSDLISAAVSDSRKDSVLIKFRNSSGDFLDPKEALLTTGNYYIKIASFGDFT